MDTITTTEARESLSRTLAGFRKSGVNSEPVIFGDHRKREAVVLPFALYERVRHEIAQARLWANTELMGDIAAAQSEPGRTVRVDRGKRGKRTY